MVLPLCFWMDKSAIAKTIQILQSLFVYFKKLMTIYFHVEVHVYSPLGIYMLLILNVNTPKKNCYFSV